MIRVRVDVEVMVRVSNLLALMQNPDPPMQFDDFRYYF